jgi:hypothetical protein
MARNDPTPEQRDDVLARLTRERADAFTQAVADGGPVTTKLILDDLGEFLADDQALATVVRKTLAGENAFAKVIADVIWTVSQASAEKEVADMERRRRQSADEARIERHLDAQAA